AVATIGLVECEDVDQYGVVVVDERGKIVGFQEKPPKGTERSKLANTGIYAFSPEMFRHIPADTFYDFGKQVFPALQAASEPFYGFDARGAYWSDIGTPAEYRRASFDVVRGVVSIPDSRAAGADPTAQLEADVAVEGPIWIGAHARIASGVRIVGPSVIGDGVRIEPGACIERTILWEGASVGTGATLRDAIVGKNFKVDPNSTLQSTTVANES
ncbi:MAG TPA: NDP-sugar synthase, partial [Candidatus Tumulicola sp.]